MPYISRPEHDKKALREGYTTGSAASAAVIAAISLLCGLEETELAVQLPPFKSEQDQIIPKSERRLTVPVKSRVFLQQPVQENPGSGVALATVTKDGGDDPDATSGLDITVAAAFQAGALEGLMHEGHLSAPPQCQQILAENSTTLHSPLALPGKVFIHTGEGIGIVTLPGLPVLPGEAAINPEPRLQIAYAARKTASDAGYHGPIYLHISIPGAEERSKDTINSRLGIIGGISILGTRGTVRPFSHAAWQATIIQELNVARAAGLKTIGFCTGRRSQEALEKMYPELPAQSFIQIADFAKLSLSAACRRGFKKIIWCCYSGKLLKLAQGKSNTHAGVAASDLALLAAKAVQCGADQKTAAQISALPTAQGVFDLLENSNRPELREKLARLTAESALNTLRKWKAPLAPDAEISLCLLDRHGELWLKFTDN